MADDGQPEGRSVFYEPNQRLAIHVLGDEVPEPVELRLARGGEGHLSWHPVEIPPLGHPGEESATEPVGLEDPVPRGAQGSPDAAARVGVCLEEPLAAEPADTA